MTETEQASAREARIAKIRKRVEALYRTGWYSAEDGKTIMRMAKTMESLIEIEWTLTDAEATIVDARSARPELVRQQEEGQ